DRPLSAHGLAEAEAAGRWLAGKGLLPDRVLCSPARRNRETLEAVLGITGYAEQRLEESIYEATPGTLIGLLEDHREVDRLMVVGHNPGLERLVALLDQGRSDDYRGMPPAAVAVLSLPAGESLAPGVARLTAFWWPWTDDPAQVVVAGAGPVFRAGMRGGHGPARPPAPHFTTAGGGRVRAGSGQQPPAVRGADPGRPAPARRVSALRGPGRPVARRPPPGTLARFHRLGRDSRQAALHRLDARRQFLRHIAASLDGIRVRTLAGRRPGPRRPVAWPPGPARRDPRRDARRRAGGLCPSGTGLPDRGPRRHRAQPLRHGRLAGGAVRARALLHAGVAARGGCAVRRWMRLLLAAALAVSASACSTLGPQQRDQAAALAVAARDASLDCERADR